MCTLLAWLVSGAPWWGGDRQTTKMSLSFSPVSSIDVSIQSQRERGWETLRERRKQTQGNNKTGPVHANAKLHCTSVILAGKSQSPALRLYDFSLLSLPLSLFLFTLRCPSCYSSSPLYSLSEWQSRLVCFILLSSSSEMLWASTCLIPEIILHVENHITPLCLF